MIKPTGYTALDLIGFTDRGAYDPTANYVKNDIVTVGNTKWRCKVDDTTGVTPAENANWTIYLESATSLAGMDDVTLTSPKNGDGLVHDGNDWKNIPIVTQAQNRVTGVHQFLYNRVTSAQVVGGLTIAPNADGSFTVGAGTATSDDTIMVSGTGSSSWSQAEQKLPVGNYYASCEGAVEGVYLRLNVEENNQQVAVRGTDVSITVSSAPSNTLAFIQVLSGTVIPVGGITIKPLIRLQSDTVKTIAPYAKTNRELTEDKAENSVIGTVENGATASKAYAVGAHFIRNGKYCIVSAAIAQGATLTENTNYIVSDISESSHVCRVVFNGDCNTLAPGIVYCGNTATNAPFNWAIIHTYYASASGTNRVQVAYGAATLGMALRMYGGGTWGAWKTVTLS